MDKEKPKIFLSYAREDIGMAKQIYNDLKRYGLNVWLDTESLLPGDRWKDKIQDAIENSNYFIALLSTKSVSKKGFVQKELKTALEVLDLFPSSERFILPVRLDDCEVGERKLKEHHWIDLFPESEYNNGIKKILEAIEKHPNRLKNRKDILTYKNTIDYISFYLKSLWLFFLTIFTITYYFFMKEIKVIYKKIGTNISKFLKYILLPNIISITLLSAFTLFSFIIYYKLTYDKEDLIKQEDNKENIKKINEKDPEKDSTKKDKTKSPNQLLMPIDTWYPFKSQSSTLSTNEVLNIIKTLDFYDNAYNEHAQGFANQFESQIINNEKIIVDHTSNLIWQYSGSERYMTFEKAIKWIWELNQKGYANFHDWRLPTIIEAMSLMEPEKKNVDLYLDPGFDTKQSSIWTSNLVAGKLKAWIIDFKYGTFGYDSLQFNNYVRGVRFLK